MMGTIHPYPKVKLITGILASREDMATSVIDILVETFGPIDYRSEHLPFTFTSYYDKEMGTPIIRFFISFKKLVNPASLSHIKIQTNRIEEHYKVDGKRKINIDPGIMFLSRFILASTKDGVQRIPMDEGIYGEITLVYEKKTFRQLEWTYPDYRSGEYIEIFNTIREMYSKQIKT